MASDLLQAVKRRLGLRPKRPARGQQLRQENANAWHQLPDIVRHVQSFLDTRDVLASDAVCVAWRAARGQLQGCQLTSSTSKKANKVQKTFLASNAPRLQAVALQLAPAGGSAAQKSRPWLLASSSASSAGTSSKHAQQMVDLACQATAVRSMQLSTSSTLVRLPASLGALKQLQVLSITRLTRLASLPVALGDLQQLQQLTIHSCRSLAALPDSLSQLTALLQLEVRGCDSLHTLPALPSNLETLVVVECGQLHELAPFDPSAAPPPQLPSAIGSSSSSSGGGAPGGSPTAARSSDSGSLGHLTRLRLLHLEKCGVKQLPDFSPAMAACTAVTITQCPNLHALPASICSLPALQELVVRLRLQALPEQLGQLGALRCLRILQGSKAESVLPASIGQLSSLEELELADWPGLAHLPITLGELHALKHFKLQSCTGLSALPRSLGSLTGLQHLVISSCTQLVALPESLGELAGLQSLALVDDEDLRSLPASIGNLAGLQHLTISYCSRLKSLPDSLGGLATSAGRLQRVTINGCDSLHTLPISMEPLKAKITPGAMAGAVAAQAIAAWRGEELSAA